MRVLGAGGFGLTYLAREETLDRSVTIKEYFPSDFAAREATLSVRPRSGDAEADYGWGLERFIEEAQTLARFDHPNINRVYRYFRANNTAYMVLHFEEGQSFKSWLNGLGPGAPAGRTGRHRRAAARCARDDPRRQFPASRHRPRQHHHPQERRARADRFRLGARRNGAAVEDGQRAGEARLQPLRAIRVVGPPAGTMDRHLFARRVPLSGDLGQAADRCADPHGRATTTGRPRASRSAPIGRSSWPPSITP